MRLSPPQRPAPSPFGTQPPRAKETTTAQRIAPGSVTTSALNSRRSAPLPRPRQECRRPRRPPSRARRSPGQARPARLPDSRRSGRQRGSEPPCQRFAERPPAARHPGPHSSPAAARPALSDCRGGPAAYRSAGTGGAVMGRRRSWRRGRAEHRLPRIGPAARAAILGLRAGSPAVFAAA